MRSFSITRFEYKRFLVGGLGFVHLIDGAKNFSQGVVGFSKIWGRFNGSIQKFDGLIVLSGLMGNIA